ncbi:MAG: sugar ABC transporter substrate-binding protein, partial [Elusimicrobiota bacterium]
MALFMPAAAWAVDISYWTSSNPEEIALARGLVAEFNAGHPGIRVKMQPIPATQSSEEVLLAAVVSRTTPDICSNILPAIMGRFTQAGAVLPLDRFPDAQAVLRARTDARLLDMFRSRDGRLYQIPWKCNPVMLAYNTKIFRALKLAPPRTYSEFDRAAAAFMDTGPSRWAMVVSIKPLWWQRLFDFYPFYAAATDGQTLLKDDKAVFDNPGAAAALRFFQEGFKKHFFPMLGFSGDIFLEGKTAMSLVGPWAIKYYRRLKPDFEFDFSPIPVPDGHQGPVYTYGDPKNIVIFSTTQHPEAVWEFAKFLISKQADLKLLETTNQIPMRRNLAQDQYYKGFFSRNPLLRKVAEQAAHVVPIDESQHLVQILDEISMQFEACAVYGLIT